MKEMYEELVVPYTKQGGGNFSIERSNDVWVIVEQHIPFALKPFKNKRKLKRAIYQRIKYTRKMVGSINDMFLLED